MNTLTQELQTHIKIVIKPLKAEEELIPVLRKRLTKKEYKLLLMMATQTPPATICEKLNIDQEACELLKNKLIKKLNQEKLKQELMI